jgi:hypothetical protein
MIVACPLVFIGGETVGSKTLDDMGLKAQEEGARVGLQAFLHPPPRYVRRHHLPLPPLSSLYNNLSNIILKFISVWNIY